MSWKITYSILAFLLTVCSVPSLCAGCKTQPPVIIDAGDIERLRSNYQQLREEYDKLRQNYSRLIEDQQFYADYYRNATAAIEAGIRELSELGADSAGEIARIRANIAILKNIVNNIIAGEQGERQQNTKADGG